MLLSLGLTYDASAVQALADNVVSAFDITEILDESGALLLNRIRTSFLAETDPEGVPWTPSAAGIKRRASGGTGTLFDTGNLFRSIQLAQEGTDGRSISSDVGYGSKYQLGLDGALKREFLGFSDADARLVEKLLEIRAKEVLG